MKFLLSIILWLGVSSVIYGAVALVINPNQTGPVHLFRPALLDDRVPKTDLFKKFAGSGPVEGLVLGSSRTLSISPRMLSTLTGKRYFNFAISAAKMSEVAGLYEEVLRYGAHPRHIVVGLDVNYLLARKKVEERQIAIANGAVLPLLAQLVLDLRSTFTVEYARDIFLWIGYQARLVPPKTGNTFEVDGTRMDVGGARLSKAEQQGRVHGCAGLMHTQFARYDGLSALQFGELKRLLKLAAADGARVEFFTTPFNPAVQSEMVAVPRTTPCGRQRCSGSGRNSGRSTLPCMILRRRRRYPRAKNCGPIVSIIPNRLATQSSGRSS